MNEENAMATQTENEDAVRWKMSGPDRSELHAQSTGNFSSRSPIKSDNDRTTNERGIGVRPDLVFAMNSGK